MVKDSHILERLNPYPCEEGFVGSDIAIMRLEVKKNLTPFHCGEGFTEKDSCTYKGEES